MEEPLNQKLKKAESEIRELKQRRSEESKANEKVARIFSDHEQSWLSERKNLRLRIRSLRVEWSLHSSNLKKKLEEKEEAMEEEANKRRELEEKLAMAEEVADELRGRASKESEDRSSELRRLKTAIAELVSNNRQLEAELARALRHAEQKETSSTKLSEEINNLRHDVRRNDKILSAMLRKSKLDADEKRCLLKEVRISKTTLNQAELESEKWRNSWRSTLKKKSSKTSKIGGKSEERSPGLEMEKCEYRRRPRALLFDFFEAENRRELDSSPAIEDEIVINDIHKLQDWVHLETEKYATILEQRHYEEIEAFTEHTRLKDEKLEALQWQLSSMEIESKQLHSHIYGLNENLSQLRDENQKNLEALLLEREEQSRPMKEQLDLYAKHCQKSNPKTTPCGYEAKTTKKKSREMEQRNPQYTSSPMVLTSPSNDLKDYSTIYINKLSSEESEQIPTSVAQNPSEEMEEEKGVIVDTDNAHESTEVSDNPDSKNFSRKADIHALGVSYKIKRLKQQLVVLDNVVAMKKSKMEKAGCDYASDGISELMKGSQQMILMVNKQVKRYQSLEEKIDELCKRMHESYRTGIIRDEHNKRAKEKTERLGRFLEETFQVQRFMVATGQKLIEIQSRISCSIEGDNVVHEDAGLNMRQFADLVKSLFGEIQRGLEVRIARIIGDVEGTLASDGILHR